MGWLHKKHDPMSARARALQNQIATLESQIARLSSQIQTPPASPTPAAEPAPAEKSGADEFKKLPAAPAGSAPGPPRPPPPAQPAEAPPARSHPRLRSTTLPHGPTILSHSAAEPPAETILEPGAGNPFKESGDLVKPAVEPQELGVRKTGWKTRWQGIKQQFHHPPASNPKLVSYLAAGSVQGLRPLRYEKRVARNRFITLAIVLALALWGLIVIFVKR